MALINVGEQITKFVCIVIMILFYCSFLGTKKHIPNIILLLFWFRNNYMYSILLVIRILVFRICRTRRHKMRSYQRKQISAYDESTK